MTSEIGLTEIIVGVGAFWMIEQFRKWRKPQEHKEKKPETQESQEIRKTIEEVKSAGGVDPQMVVRLEKVARERGLNIKISDYQDNTRTFAELKMCLESHPIEYERKELTPPPAPNTLRSLNMSRERLLRPSDLLKKREKTGVGNVWITQT